MAKPIRLILPWLLIAIVVIALDQWTKAVATNELECFNTEERTLCYIQRDQKAVVLTSWFKFRLAHNYGAAFSFLGDAGGWQTYFFSILAIVVSIFLVVWIVKTSLQQIPGRWCELLALSLILGGAIGNVYDRITLGYVIDFIVWHYQEKEFPTFNIADSAICVGAGLLIFDILFLQKKLPQEVSAN